MAISYVVDKCMEALTVVKCKNFKQDIKWRIILQYSTTHTKGEAFKTQSLIAQIRRPNMFTLDFKLRTAQTQLIPLAQGRCAIIRLKTPKCT
uniref:Protein CLP1 homolog n=1 Tax=Mesocestoides corti TaxID=53468 RepID=A0A5K3ERM4_MESCO